MSANLCLVNRILRKQREIPKDRTSQEGKGMGDKGRGTQVVCKGGEGEEEENDP